MLQLYACLNKDPNLRPSFTDTKESKLFKGEEGKKMENASLKWHFFLSHNQREGSGQSGSLHEIGLQNGVDSWLDVNQALMTRERMKQGVQNSDTLVLVLTGSVLSRPFCLLELLWAVAGGKRVVAIKEEDQRLAAAIEKFDKGADPPGIEKILETQEPELAELLKHERVKQVFGLKKSDIKEFLKSRESFQIAI